MERSHPHSVRSPALAAGRANRLAAVFIAVILLTGVYAMIPVPLEGLHPPQVRALQGFKRSGDGVSTLTHARVVSRYENLNLSEFKRQQIRDELISEGYVTTGGDRYSKRVGWLYPVTYKVWVTKYMVAIGATRHKLPFK